MDCPACLNPTVLIRGKLQCSHCGRIVEGCCEGEVCLFPQRIVMDADTYQELTGRTESIVEKKPEKLPEGCEWPYIELPDNPGYIGVPLKLMRLVHHILGMAGEAGELCDQLKRHMFYFKKLDATNLFEECGDSDWYNKRLLASIDRSATECMDRNIAKLTARYPGKFSSEAAINRDVQTERAVLETPAQSTRDMDQVCTCGGLVYKNGLCRECFDEYQAKMARTRPGPGPMLTETPKVG